MSDTLTITLPDPATAADFTVAALAAVGVQSGVVTDFNAGSQIRTLVESMGGVVETQGVIAQALAFQAIIYSAFGAFGIEPTGPQPATGTVTITTGLGSNPPPASQNVLIPSGSLLQSNGGIQFVTTADVLLAVGATTVTVAIVAVQPGVTGNVAAATITALVSSPAYPLFVTNTLATKNGTDAEPIDQTLQRFTSKVLSLGLASPISIANACIGVMVANTSEIVKYATVFEAWINQAVGSQTAGFQVVVDNGAGAASAALLAAVKVLLDGSLANAQDGQRPAGVPYSIAAVTPVLSSVTLTGTLLVPTMAPTLLAAVNTAVIQYYNSLNFGDSAEQTGLVAAFANVLAGYVTNLSVTLNNSAGTSVLVVPTTGVQRCILSTFTPSLT